MNQLEHILHQAISVAWNNTYKGTPEHKRLICNWNNAPTKQYGNKMRIMGVKEGVPDWQWVASGGRTVWIELKVGDGKQSEKQEQFEYVCRLYGHRYEIARTYRYFFEVIGVQAPKLSETTLAKLHEHGLY